MRFSVDTRGNLSGKILWWCCAQYIYPMDFRTYNNSISDRRRGNRLIMRSFYEEWSQIMKGRIVRENRAITAFNHGNSMATPFAHKRIFTRRRGRYAFRGRFLVDGLHPNTSIIQDWIAELHRAMNINELAHRRLTDQRWEEWNPNV